MISLNLLIISSADFLKIYLQFVLIDLFYYNVLEALKQQTASFLNAFSEGEYENVT